MYRYFLTIVACCVAGASLSAATLQQISLDDMAASSTAIVRARVTGSSAAFTGRTIYTHYRLSVSETWKGRGATEVMIPGGTVNGVRQDFPGVPELSTGSEYVLFVWTSRSGIVHLVGLTQGVFQVAAGPDGVPMATRPEAGELMLNAQGQKVADQAVRMRLSDMRQQVAARLSTGVTTAGEAR